MNETGSIDYALIVSVLILLAVGIVMVYSASAPILASKQIEDSNFYLKKHLVRLAIGLLLMFIVSRIDYHFFRKLSIPALALAFVFLIAVLVIDSAQVKGVSRWINFGGFSFQPSVFAQYVLIFYFADALVRKQEKIENFSDGFLPMLLILCAVAMLVILEPDYSTTAVITMLAFLIFFIGNVRLLHLFATGIAAMPFFILGLIFAPYRMERFTTFLDPYADPQGSGYQVIQSIIALGSGGMFGVGIGQSKQKLLYLPEAYTDFIYSILGEELGFFGAFAVLTLFLIVLWRGMSIAFRAPDLYGRLLASGISLSIALGAFIHVGVVSGVLPTTGLPMPFISYGGSALVLTLTAVGVLLNISRQTVKKPPQM